MLCVHGMSGAATNWTDLMAELAPDFDCAAVDLPGSGFSAAAGEAVRLLDQGARRDRDQAHRGAGSRSGPPDRQFDGRGGLHPGRRLPPGPGEDAHARLADASRPAAAPLDRALPDPHAALRRRRRWCVAGHWCRPRTGWPACTARATTTRPPCTPTGSRRRWPRCAGATSSATTRPRWSARREPWSPRRWRPRWLSLWRAAERVEAPTLVLFGSHDRLVSPALAVPAARAFKHAQIEVLPRIGHIGQMERPDLVAARFREMVGKTGMPGGGTRLTPDELTST